MKLCTFTFVAATVVMMASTELNAAPFNSVFQLKHSSVKEQQSCHSGFEEYEKVLEIARSKPSFDEKSFIETYSKDKHEARQKELLCEVFHYEVDNVLVEGFILQQANVNQKQPIIIYNRDGATGWGGLDYLAIQQRLAPLAELGYLVIATQYRGLDLWPGKVSGDLGKDEFGGKDLNDVQSLLPILNQVTTADTDKIAMVGEGRGGMMSYMLSKKMPEIKAIVAIGTASDLADQLILRNDLLNVYQQHIPDFNKTPLVFLEQRSVTNWIPELPKKLPVLILHGEEDKIVDIGQANLLQTLLKGAKRDSTFIAYPDAMHDLGEQRTKAIADIHQWLQSKL